MKFSRRDFIHAGCTIAGATLVPHFMDVAKARIMHGGPGPVISALSKRNVLNMNFEGQTNEYMFIDHVKSGSGMFGPFSTAFTGAGQPTWPSILDANGWPSAAASGISWGGGWQTPDPNNFNGPYTIDFTGNGAFSVSGQLPSGFPITATLSAQTGCTTTNNSGSIQVTSTAGAGTGSFQFTYTTPVAGTGPLGLLLVVSATGSGGFPLKNIRVYRTADASDLAAGLVFRRPWKQAMIDLCPGAIRFMNWTGGNDDTNARWEDRKLPTNAGYAISDGWTCSPNYQTKATGNNQMFVAAATPTATNTRTTPANMTHGEAVTFCIPSTGGAQRATELQVRNITNAANGVVNVGFPIASITWAGSVATVTTVNPHGYSLSLPQAGVIIAGAVPSGYNGTFTVQGVTTTTFTYSLASNPGTETTPGNFGTQPHGYNTGDIVGHFFSDVNNNTGSVTLGSNQITGTSTGIGDVTGCFVYGQAIPPNTTILSRTLVGSNYTLTMSNNATGTPSGNVGLGFRSMQNLHAFPCNITVIDALTYQTNVNTTSMGAFIVPTSEANVFSYQFQTLQAGTGGDRGGFSAYSGIINGYPITSHGGGLPLSFFGGGPSASSYYTYHFDKTISLCTDGSGNPLMGAWIVNSSGGQIGTPIEICTTMINELNAMSPAHIIGMWINIPYTCLMSMDPDYTSASSWPINAIDCIVNPASTVRAPGYNALGYSGSTQVNTPPLIVEYSNENGFGNDQTSYLQAKGIGRWGNSIYPMQDYQDMQSLRSTCMVADIRGAISSTLLTNTKFVLGMFGTKGMGTNTGNSNYAVTFGGNITPLPRFAGDWYINDTLTVSKGWGTPLSQHDGVCPATYFDANNGYYVCFGAGSFQDDSAMYHGVDNSGALIVTGGTPASFPITYTTGNPSISGTNTLVAGQPITLASSINFTYTGGNTTTSNLVVSATGLSGSAFQVTTPSGIPLTPNATGSNTVNMPKLLAVTVSAGTPVLHQPITGTGITTPSPLPSGSSAATTIEAISGTSPNYVLTLSATAAVTAGTTITSIAPSISWQGTVAGTTLTLTGASTQTINGNQFFTGAGVPAGTFVINLISGTNGAIGSTYKLNNSFTISSPVTMSNAGGNYIGAANPTQALTNFVAAVVDAPNNFNTESPTNYATNKIPSYSTGVGLTKFVLGYEGGADWQATTGAGQGGHIFTVGDGVFSFAAYNCSQWATAQTNFYNTICALPNSNVFIPGLYLAINPRWGYAWPDDYATISGTPTEGAALTVNSQTWIAMGNRNVALPN